MSTSSLPSRLDRPRLVLTIRAELALGYSKASRRPVYCRTGRTCKLTDSGRPNPSAASALVIDLTSSQLRNGHHSENKSLAHQLLREYEDKEAHDQQKDWSLDDIKGAAGAVLIAGADTVSNHDSAVDFSS